MNKKFEVLPARAGVILELSGRELYRISFTRTRGGDPRNMFDILKEGEFYPHARG